MVPPEHLKVIYIDTRNCHNMKPAKGEPRFGSWRLSCLFTCFFNVSPSSSQNKNFEGGVLWGNCFIESANQWLEDTCPNLGMAYFQRLCLVSGTRDAQLSSIWRGRNQIQESRNDPGPSPGSTRPETYVDFWWKTAHLQVLQVTKNNILDATILNQSKYLKQICSQSF